MVSGRVAPGDPAVEIPERIREDWRSTGRRMPALAGKLVDLPPGLGAEAARQLELAPAQDADGECPRCDENREGCVRGIDADDHQQRVEAHLRDPRCREGVPLAFVRRAHDVEAVREPAKHLQRLITHGCLDCPESGPVSGRPIGDRPHGWQSPFGVQSWAWVFRG